MTARAEPLAPLGATRIMIYRNYLSYRSAWYIFLSGFLEPVFYLFSIGVGVGKLIDSFEFHGETIGYAAFVAPAMLATSAMNGAVLDSTFNFFFKLKFTKLFDQILATPMSTRDVATGKNVAENRNIGMVASETYSKSCQLRMYVVSARQAPANAKPISSAAGSASSAHQDSTSPIAAITPRKPNE